MKIKVTFVLTLGMLVVVLAYIHNQNIVEESSISGVSQKPYTASTDNRTLLNVEQASVKQNHKEHGVNASGITLSEEIDRIMSNSDSKTALKAYKLINSCLVTEMQIKEIKLLPYDSQDVKPRQEQIKVMEANLAGCETLTVAQKNNRLNLLDRAVKANVHGAAVEFLNAGPFGDPSALQGRPDDANVVNWKKQAIEQLEAAAKSGDKSTFVPLTQVYEMGVLTPPNLELASIYAIAKAEALRLEGDQKTSNGFYAYAKVLEKNLPPDRIQYIEREGKKLAEICCKK